MKKTNHQLKLLPQAKWKCTLPFSESLAVKPKRFFNPGGLNSKLLIFPSPEPMQPP